MSVPYKDADDLVELGNAGYLKIESSDGAAGFTGAFFVINARGEPIEFTYNRIETPHTFLWRQDDIRRHASRKLITSLFSLCTTIPKIILCLAKEINGDLFTQELHVSIPICRIAPAIEAVGYSNTEVPETVAASDALNAFWFPGKPVEESPEYRLFFALITRGLLLEPFSRASSGLSEVYTEQKPTV